MNKPEFSVVIPLFNNADHIVATLQSIQAQKYPVKEIIVVDDGSSDDGALRVLNAAIPNLTLIQQENQGVSMARNNGAAQAKCEYVAFLDADDEWMPFFTEEMAMLISHFPEAEFFASRYQCIDAGGVAEDARIRLNRINPYGMLMDNYFEIASKGDLPFIMSSSVIQKTLFEDLGGFPVGEAIGADQELFIKVALKGPVAYSPNVHVRNHRDTANRAMDKVPPARECPFSARLQVRLQNSSFSEKLKRDIERYRAAHLNHLARQNIRAGRYTNALSLLADVRANHKPIEKLVLSTIAFAGLLQQQMRAASNRFGQ